MPVIRYPDRSVVDSLLTTMITRRSSAPDAERELVHIWGFTGTGRSGEHNAAGLTPFNPDEIPDTEGSPILEIATRMMEGMGGRLWGFGLAHRTLSEAVSRDIGHSEGGPSRAKSITVRRPSNPVVGPNAEEVWAATIFDARGHEYTYLQYLHMPELEPILWDDDTLSETADWIDRIAQGVIAAHVWAATMALDAVGNEAIVADIQRRLLE
jgi:hypothetical protein